MNSNGKVIGRVTFQARGWWNFSTSYNRSPAISISDDDRKQVSFTNVKADDITDRLTIRITSVNGIDAQTAAQTGVLQIKAINKEEWDSYLSFTMTKGVLTGYSERDRSTALVIPNTIWGELVTSIGPKAFQGKGLTSVTIPDSVTSIGNETFADNRLTSVTIPASVTSIGNGAFRYNDITKITVVADITIKNDAFILKQDWRTDEAYHDFRFGEYYNKQGRRAGIYLYTSFEGWSSLAFDTPEEQLTQTLAKNRLKSSVIDTLWGLFGIGLLTSFVLLSPKPSTK